jgi:hypothetical protein
MKGAGFSESKTNDALSIAGLRSPGESFVFKKPARYTRIGNGAKGTAVKEEKR